MNKSYQEMARFIAENLHDYATSEVVQAYKVCFSYKVSGILGIHIDSRTGTVFSLHRDYKIDFEAPTADDAAKKVRDYVRGLGIPWDTFVVYASIYGTMAKLVENEDRTFRYWGDGTDLCQLIMVVNDFEAHDNYARVYKEMEAQHVKSLHDTFLFEYSGIIIKLFKNNRLDFKKVTPDFMARLDAMFHARMCITRLDRHNQFVKK